MTISSMLLFALSIGFVNIEYGYFIWAFWVIFVVQYIKKGNIQVNALGQMPFFLLIVFTFSYAFFSHSDIKKFIFYYFINIPLLYLAGWIWSECRENSVQAVRNTIYLITLGLGIHVILNYSINIGKTRWTLTDFFSGNIASATGRGALNTFIFATVTYWLIVEKNLMIKIISIVLFLASFLYALLLGTRTQFIILIVCLVCGNFLYQMEKDQVKGAFKFLFICAVIGLICYWFYNSNIGGIKTMIDASNLMNRMESMHASELSKSDNYRTSSLWRGLVNLLNYPFGGLINETYYHNTWTDIGRISGIIPFMGWLIYSIIEFRHVIVLMKEEKIIIEIRYLLFSLYLGMYINLFVEPGMEGFRWFIYSLVLINGMVDRLYYSINKKNYFNKTYY